MSLGAKVTITLILVLALLLYSSPILADGENEDLHEDIMKIATHVAIMNGELEEVRENLRQYNEELSRIRSEHGERLSKLEGILEGHTILLTTIADQGDRVSSVESNLSAPDASLDAQQKISSSLLDAQNAFVIGSVVAMVAVVAGIVVKWVTGR